MLKHIIRCYLRLTENPKAKEALRQVLPASLQDSTFVETLRPDRSAAQWLPLMLSKVFEDRSYPAGPV